MRKFYGEYREWDKAGGGVVRGDRNKKYPASIMYKKAENVFE